MYGVGARQIYDNEVEIGYTRECLEEDGDDLELTVRARVELYRGCRSIHAASDADYYGYADVDEMRAFDRQGEPVVLRPDEERDCEERLIEEAKSDADGW
jgi:hypothetical protein